MIKKKVLSIILAACLTIAPAADLTGDLLQGFEVISHAEVSGQFEYTLLPDGTAAVSGYTGNESSVVIPSKLGGKTITQIADNAFGYNQVLERIAIPSAVKSIGESAFSHCCKLTQVDLPNELTAIGASAFESCISLTAAPLPSSLKTLGQSAFKNCVSIRQAVIPKDIKQIGERTFESCTSLESVTLPGSLQSIAPYAFSLCSSLTEITLPNGAVSIGDHAFNKCSALVKAVLPDTVSSIGGSAFMYCESLTEVNIPRKVTAINNYLFTGCTSLEEITLHQAITTIGYGAFLNCTNLDNIEIPSNVSVISGRAFENCFSLRAAYIREGVRSISERAFENCSKLAFVSIPDSVTRISRWAFSGCRDLVSLDIGSGTQLIESYAFYNCPSLKSVFIPQNVASVGTQAFGYCYDHGNTVMKGFKIYCDEDSAAHKYAGENSIDHEFVDPDDMVRIFGAARFETSMLIADRLRAENDGQLFKNIIIASGTSFADALSASYLAAVRNAPILITSGDEKVMDSVAEYIKSNADNDCQLYIIGGEAAVSGKMADRLSDMSVLRISGENRYTTNLEVLKAAGVSGEDILVASGANFADALSASAVGKPILLVDSKAERLTSEQEEFLSGLAKNSDTALTNAYIIGGTAAVSEGTENHLSELFKSTSRVCGSNRFDTSLQVAKTFFGNASPDSIVVTYGLNYPDGLCAGPLAAKLGCPMLLVTDNNIANAVTFAQSSGVSKVLALGGPALISDSSLKRISNAGKTA